MQRLFFTVGAWLAGLSVAIGAYSAHGATQYMNADQLRWLAKGARYQMYHALALLAVAWALTYWTRRARMLKAAGWLFIAGTVFFAGSLYLMAFTGSDLGYVTPTGGVSYIVGWALLGEAARRG